MPLRLGRFAITILPENEMETRVPYLLSIEPFGDRLFLSLLLLALIVPVVSFWLRSQRWRFGLRELMCVVFFCVVLCAFSARDLRRMDDLAIEFARNPVWCARELFLLPAIVAVISTCASAFAFWRRKVARAQAHEAEERLAGELGSTRERISP